MKRRTLAAASVWTAAAAGGLLAQDWPQWRGPARDGRARAVNAPAEWPASLRQAWKTSVGTGHASAVVVGASVFAFGRTGEEEVLSSLELATGKPRWKQSYPAPYSMNSAAASHGKGPKATPTVAGGRVYTFGISGVLSAFDAASGRLAWRKDFKDAYGGNNSPEFGVASSPAVEQGALVVQVGTRDGGAIKALDAATGAERWSLKGEGPAYASPVVATLAGTPQVVTFTQTRLLGVDLASGAVLWSQPFTTAYDQNSVTPVAAAGDTVIASGLDQGLRAVHITKAGAAFKADNAWQVSDVSLYMSSPVLDGERLFGFSHKQKGQLFALDPRSGKVLWTSPGRQGENAALVDVGTALLVLTTNSELLVLRKDAPAFAPVRTYQVADSPTWAH
ncbi:MAG TPA: PQQ-binding-like beta-propeller repeat protein, partial [Vicinamibacteria bacterium]